MSSLLIAVLSALVLALSGTVMILAVQLHAAKKDQKAEKPRDTPTEKPETAALRQERERAARLGMDLKRSLTHIHTTIPSAIPGLSIERLRLLCADSLKDQVNAVLNTFQNGFQDQFAPGMEERDFARLDELVGRLSSIAADVEHIDETLTPIFKTWSPDSNASFDSYEQELAALSRQLNKLHQEVQALLRVVSERRERVEAVLPVQERFRRAVFTVSHPTVRAALTELETLARQRYDSLDRQTKARVESYYLQTLELILRELGRAEQAGENTDTRVRLSLRVIRVLTDVLDAGQQTRSEISERSLEAEVTALERLAALRGDTAQ